MCRGHRAALSHMALKEQERRRERGRWRGREWEWGRWKEKMKGRTRKRAQVNVYKIKSTFTLSLVLCSWVFLYFQIFHSCPLYLDLQGSSKIAVYPYDWPFSYNRDPFTRVFFPELILTGKKSVLTPNFCSQITVNIRFENKNLIRWYTKIRKISTYHVQDTYICKLIIVSFN